MNSRKKMIFYGFINAVFMYLIYPLNRIFDVITVFLGAPYIAGYIIIYIVHIIVNVFFVYLLTRKNSEDNLITWIHISIGSVLGSIGTMIIFLMYSDISDNWLKYPYGGAEIPFRLTTVLSHMQYFLIVIIYILFVYELSKKLYKFIIKH